MSPPADRPGAGPPSTSARGTPAVEDLTGERVLAKCRWIERDGRRRPSLGGLELLARLGKGGMGVVYYGVNPRLDTEVAVKILPRADSEEHDELVNRFVREAKLAAKLRSDHLVGVLDVNRDEDSGNHFLVMEYVRGQSAGAWLRGVVKAGEKGVPEAAALDVVIAATKGLAAAHLAGVVHRDIKPDNVLIPADSAGRLQFARSKLADLGLARPEAGEQSLTGHAVALGTPGYMAPEQAQDAKRAKKPADVFAMGATLYALLAGKAPFAGATAMDAILRTLQREHAPIRTVSPYVSPATAELLDHCLAKDPAQRYTDAPALLQALELCRAALSQSDTESADAVSLVASLVQQEERGQRVRTDASGGRSAVTPAPAPATAASAAATEPFAGATTSRTPAGAPDAATTGPASDWTPPSAVLQLISGGGAREPVPKPRRTAWIVAIVLLVGAAVAGGLLFHGSGAPAKEPASPGARSVQRDAESRTVERTELPAKLSRAVGTFAVEGGAPHARVTLVRDGEPARAYDFALDDAGRLAPADCEAGSYAVTAARDGFEPFTGRVEIDEGRPATVSATMRERDALLSVTTRPPGAEVLVDEVAVGRTPLSSAKVRPGSRSVRLRLAEHGEVVRSVAFGAGRAVDLDEIHLSPWPVLELRSLGDGVTAEVGGVPLSGRVAVAPGTVALRLLRPGCVEQTRTIEVALGETVVVRPETWRELTTPADPAPQGAKPPDVGVEDVGVEAGPEAPLDDATRRRLLTDLAAWDAASSAQRRAAAEAVARRATGFALKELGTFSCGGSSHEVATFVHERTELEFVLVPGGTFPVGSPEGETGRAGDERQHTVTLTRPFLIARTECTQAAYERVLGSNPSQFRGASLPVEKVSWDAAKTFCDRAGLQLPSEAQWEVACRAGTTTRFCAGDADADLSEVAWFETNAGAATHDVGAKKPNAFGLFDMHGNVWEWCADGYGPYRTDAATDPSGASGAPGRVFRGGAWDHAAKGARSAYRGGRARDYRGPDFGFRPARLLTAE